MAEKKRARKRGREPSVSRNSGGHKPGNTHPTGKATSHPTLAHPKNPKSPPTGGKSNK